MGNVDIQSFMEKNFKVADFTHLHWEGSFQEYIDRVSENPLVARNAFQRIYDMIISFGTKEYVEYK